MSWISIIWSMVAASCLTLAGVYLYVWLRQRQELASLMFCIVAASTAGMAACELWIMNTTSLEVYGQALQWYNLLRWFVTVALVGFVHFYLQSGRLWLELTVVGLRTLGLVLSFIFSPNVYYSRIEELRRISFLGEMVTIADGIPDPLTMVSQVSLLLLAAYLVDSTLRSYMRGDHSRALRVGLSSVFFVLALSVQMILVLWGVVEAPIVASLFFMGIVFVMGVELSEDMLRAARLARELQAREVELRRERELMDAIFQNAPGLLHLHAMDGSIVRWNAQHKKVTGFSDEQTRTMRAEELFPVSERALWRRASEQAFADGEHEVEMDLSGRDGSALRHFFRLVRVEVGGQPCLVGIGVDVSAQQALAAESEKQREQVAHLARVASVSELSSSLAHELNQPLAIILSNAQAAQRLMARKTPDMQELREILDDIVEADIRAADVIRRLRSILKRGEPALESVTPHALFDEALKMAHPDLKSGGIVVSRRHSKKLPVFLADRIPVEQVLLNLIKNACDAMRDNGSRGRALSLTCSSEGEFLCFSVRDNGEGLPQDSSKIFEAFHTTKSNGLGLGLTICQTIIHAHGGKLWAEPNKSRGATFHFNLPLNLSSQ
ncbi:MAG: sensor histidine kinase [Terrimicrobiaceae bacterium]